MANLDQVMQEALGIAGAFAAAIADYDSGMTLAHQSNRASFDAELAGSLNSEVVKAKLSATKSLGISQSIEDVLISLSDQYHLIRLIPGTTLFVYLALDRDKSNLAMARHSLKAVEPGIVAAVGI